VIRGKLEAIWLKRGRRGPMDPVSRATLRAGLGLVGNTDQGGRRQVTVIDKAMWSQLMDELGVQLDPSARRANLMVSGVTLAESRGRILRIGDCRIEVAGETRPCERMDEAAPGLRSAMLRDWGGGVFGMVLDDGRIEVGDVVELE
jgi:MOSC domain-containing protein YiiM